MVRTPGTWRFLRLSWGCQVISGSTVIVAISTDLPGMPKKVIEQRIGDARLISFAPRLVDAVKDLLPFIHEDEMDGETPFEVAVLSLEKVISEMEKQ